MQHHCKDLVLILKLVMCSDDLELAVSEHSSILGTLFNLFYSKTIAISRHQYLLLQCTKYVSQSILSVNRVKAQDGGQPPMSTEKICLIILTDGSVQPPGIAVGNYTGYVYEADPIGHRSDLQIPRTPTGMLYNVFDLYISFGICIVF